MYDCEIINITIITITMLAKLRTTELRVLKEFLKFITYTYPTFIQDITDKSTSYSTRFDFKLTF